MGKTEVINGYKLGGPLSDARHVLIHALHLIDEAEKAGNPITRGDLVSRACSAFSVSSANYSWLGSPGPKSPVDKLYTREKLDGVYVMKMMEEGRALLGTGLSFDDLWAGKMHERYEKEGVFKVIKVGDILNHRNINRVDPVVVVNTCGKRGVTVLKDNGTVDDVHVTYLHALGCDCLNYAPSGEFFHGCLYNRES